MNPIVAELPTWVQVAIAVGPIGLLVVGLVGGFVAYLNYRQKRRADIRAEWWRRVQFAIEMAFSDDPESSRVGTELLAALAKQRESTSNDTRLLEEILRIIRGEEKGDPAGSRVGAVLLTGAHMALESLQPYYFPASWLAPRRVESEDESEGGRE